jgi:hypothetical protein
MLSDVYGTLEFEADLIESQELRTLIEDESFAIKLYSTLCNNEFHKENKTYFPSFRYAGGFVAYLRNIFFNFNETYLDFYMSGNEGVIFPEVSELLKKLGWTVKE